MLPDDLSSTAIWADWWRTIPADVSLQSLEEETAYLYAQTAMQQIKSHTKNQVNMTPPKETVKV